MMMKIKCFLLIAVVAAFNFCCKKEVKIQKGIIVQSFFGEVKVERGGSQRQLVAGELLNAGDAIVTGKSSIADLLYFESGVIRVNEASRLELSTIYHTDEKENTAISLGSGKVFVTLSKVKKGSSFEIKTATTIAAVRGTSLRVSAADSKSSIDVLYGKVSVSPVKDGKVVSGISQTVESNKTVTLDEKGVNEIIKTKKDIKVETLKKTEIEAIKVEAKNISVARIAAPEVKKELDSIGIENVELDIKPVVPDEKTRLQEKARADEEEKERKALSEKQARDREAAEKKLANERALKDSAEKERLENERTAKEKSERERLERLEKERIAQEKKEKKESRVKNIPNI